MTSTRGPTAAWTPASAVGVALGLALAMGSPIACGARSGLMAVSTGAGGATGSTSGAGGAGGQPVCSTAGCASLDDACNVGACVNGACVAVPTNEEGACDQGTFCMPNATCHDGVCAGTPRSCPPSDACHAATCDEGAMACVETPITACGPADGCCPAGCTPTNDPDCGPCCGDQLNPTTPSSSPCTLGATWIAWQYIPSCSFEVTRIELHTTDGSAALLADANDSPGAFLFQGALGIAEANGWRGVDVTPPIQVVGGKTYWIGEDATYCSVAESGTPYPYYGSFQSGQWNGPYMSADHAWTARIVGSCP